MVLGFSLARSGFLKVDFNAGLTRFLYWVSLPALVIHSLTSHALVLGEAGAILVRLAAASVLATALALVVAKAGRLQPMGQATFAQAVLRGNQALIGLPLLLYAAGDRAGIIIPIAIMVLGPVMLAYNVVSVLLFSFAGPGSGSGSGWSTAWKALVGLRSNPLILATAVGGVLAVVPLEGPAFAHESLRMVAATAGPLALVSIGASLSSTRLRGVWHWPLASSLLKVGVLPLLAWATTLLWPLDPDSRLVLLFFSATPTAAASVILAREMGGEEALASSAVAVSTVLSMGSLAVVLALLG